MGSQPLDNRTLIREVNELVAATFAREDWMEVLCECGRAGCTRLVPVRRAEYDSITSADGGLVVDRDHAVEALAA
jgi:hypothetical protein